jgi:hypothetical protein
MVADLVAAVVVIFFSWWRQPLQQTLRRWGWRGERYCILFTARYPQVISALASWTSCLKWQAITSAKTAKEKQTPLAEQLQRPGELLKQMLMGVQFKFDPRTTQDKGHRIDLPTSAEKLKMSMISPSATFIDIFIYSWRAADERPAIRIFVRHSKSARYMFALRGCCT